MTVHPIDTEALRRLADAAFPREPWAIWEDLTDGGYIHVGNAQGVIPPGEMATPEDSEPNPVAKVYTPELARFIAACDPPTVLALLDALAAAEHRATRAEAQSAIRGRAVVIYRERARKAEAERDQARAQADRVRALHQPQTLTSLIDDDCANEMCDHEDYCPTDSTAVVCAECDRVAEAGSPYYGENGVEAALYPCPTIRALEGDA